MRESAFILQHLSLGISDFCVARGVMKESTAEGGAQWQYYAGMMEILGF